ncbi:MAG: hypothetical protein RI988_2943 [Pseudomonadota bacterium]|jgi:hypothetical protein
MTLYANFAAWTTGVRTWLNADNLTDAEVQGFISLAQSRLNRELNAWEMEATINRTAASGSVTLPADFSRIRQVSVDGVGTYEAATKGEIANRKAADDETQRLFAIDAGQIILWPTLVDGTVVAIDYYVAVPPISVSVSSNVFTTSYSDLMLWACLIEGSNYIVEDDRAALFEAKYLSALKAANENPKRVKLGSTPLRRTLRII